MDLEELYKCQCDRVYRVAMLYLKSPYDAEDAVQNVFMKLMDRPMKKVITKVVRWVSHERAEKIP